MTCGPLHAGSARRSGRAEQGQKATASTSHWSGGSSSRDARWWTDLSSHRTRVSMQQPSRTSWLRSSPTQSLQANECLQLFVSALPCTLIYHTE